MSDCPLLATKGCCSVSSHRLTAELLLRILLIYDDIAGSNQKLSSSAFHSAVSALSYTHMHTHTRLIYIFIAENSDPILAFILFFFVLKSCLFSNNMSAYISGCKFSVCTNYRTALVRVALGNELYSSSVAKTLLGGIPSEGKEQVIRFLG